MDTTKLVPRIIGAFTFKTAVYDDVENDPSFTQTAYIIVVLASIIGSITSLDLVAIIISAIMSIVGFFIGAWVISWVGRTVFKASVTTDELIRTLGLAYVWHFIGILGIIPCLGILIGFVVAILGLVAWFVAAKAALDLDWVQTLVTVFIGWLVLTIITFVTTMILGVIGVGTGLINTSSG
jgi:hypothetical protein